MACTRDLSRLKANIRLTSLEAANFVRNFLSRCSISLLQLGVRFGYPPLSEVIASASTCRGIETLRKACDEMLIADCLFRI